MRRPLLWVALFYLFGLLLGRWCPQPLIILFSAGFTVTAAALAFRRLRFFLIWPLVLLVAWINFISQTAVISPNDLRALLHDNAADLVVHGRLTDPPDRRLHIRNGVEKWRTLAEMRVDSLGDGTNWQSAVGDLLVITPENLPMEYFNGEDVEIAGVIEPTPPTQDEGQFDYRAYLHGQGIDYELKVDSSANWHLLSPKTQKPKFSDRFLAYGQTNLMRGLPEIDEPLQLLWDMTLGWHEGISNDTYEPFMKSGTMHIFAISGLHIALIAAIFVALLRVVQVPRLWCGAAIIPLIWFYTYATGWQPSAIRATIMMTIIIGGLALKRPSDLLNSLAVAGLIILTYDPRQLFGTSFQLSFFVVLSIALLVPPLEKVRERLLQTDPLLPAELIPRWKRWLHAPLRFLFTSMTIAIAAFLGSWPLVAYYFHIFSPITLLANLIVVPLSSAALACNLGSLICGSWLPFVTVLFNNSAWFWMSLIIHISKAIIEIPCAYYYVAGPTSADFVIYYAALLAVLSGFAFKKRVRKWAFAAAICIAAFYGWRWYMARTTTTLTVLPLYGGSAVFVQPGNPHQNLLIDCGNTNLVDSVTTPFLHGRGINHLPALALTHGDLRDIGGALEIRDSFSVQHVYTSNIRFRSTTYRRIVEALEQTPGLHTTVQRGDSIGQWQILNPATTNHFTQADDSALVLKGEFHGVCVLLLSDLGQPGQRDLLQTTNDLHADIVVTGLPQEGEPIGDALLDAIQPQLVIVADSDLPATRRAGGALHDRVAQRNIPVRYTRTDGSITITIRSKAWTVTTMSGEKISGRIPEK